MPTAQKIQEEGHALLLCTSVFESPYTVNFTRFFSLVFDRIPTHFIYASNL